MDSLLQQQAQDEINFNREIETKELKNHYTDDEEDDDDEKHDLTSSLVDSLECINKIDEVEEEKQRIKLSSKQLKNSNSEYSSESTDSTNTSNRSSSANVEDTDNLIITSLIMNNNNSNKQEMPNNEINSANLIEDNASFSLASSTQSSSNSPIRSSSEKLLSSSNNCDLIKHNLNGSSEKSNEVSGLNENSSSNSNSDQKLNELEQIAENLSLIDNSNASTSSVMKRTHLKNLIYELYELNNRNSNQTDSSSNSSQNNSKLPQILIESYMEKLPPGKNLKNSLLLAWKKKYFKLNSQGVLYVYEIEDNSRSLSSLKNQEPVPSEVYNLMGGRVEYEQNRVISLDDNRGNCIVFRCCVGSPTLNQSDNDNSMFLKWKNAIDSQIIDRSELLWVTPNQTLVPNNYTISRNPKIINDEKKVLIIDIGTCSIRAGLFSKEAHLPKIFMPTVCARDFQSGKLKIGFEAFDSILASSAPSTIDLRRAVSNWSISSGQSSTQLIFPLKSKSVIDKLNIDMECIEAIIDYIVEVLNINCSNYHVVLVTPQKFSDKVNVQFLNMLLVNEKFQFESATLINQTLLTLYAYNATVGIIANLGEKIDIVPYCNGVTFQSGVTNLAYGGTVMSEYLNSFISRGHINYINDMEQYLVRYVKEHTCYTSLNYKDEIEKFPNDTKKYSVELTGQANEFKKIEFPESARFKTVEGLFNPEIWGIDGQGIHKLIHKAIQSSSMDLRKEMARSIYLCGGMSRIPGLKERLEKELKLLLPPALIVKVNCSDYSYHSAFLGAYRFIQQPEFEQLLISRNEWSNENVNCLRKWRMM